MPSLAQRLALRGLRLPAVLLALLAPAAAPAQQTYDIPVLLSLTGGGAFLGKQEEQALLLQEKLLNRAGGIHGKPIRFQIQDDKSNPQVAVQLMTGLLAGGAKLIFGPSFVASCRAVEPLIQKGPVVYCFSAAAHPPPGSFMFTTSVSTADQGEVMLRFARQKGWTRIALVTSADAVGQDADKTFDALFAREEFKDLKFVSRLYFNPSDVAVAAQMTKLRGADPQVWIGWSTGAGMTMVWRSAKQAGLELPSLTFGGNMTYDQMERFAAVLPKEFYFTSSQFPVHGGPAQFSTDARVAKRQAEMFEAYAAMGMKPDEASVLSWDPATIMFDVLNRLPESASAEEIRSTVAELRDQPSVSGLFDYRRTPQSGLAIDQTVVSIWDAEAGRWNVVASMADGMR